MYQQSLLQALRRRRVADCLRHYRLRPHRLVAEELLNLRPDLLLRWRLAELLLLELLLSNLRLRLLLELLTRLLDSEAPAGIPVVAAAA